MNNFSLSCIHPTGFLIHGSDVLISLALFIWWTRKDALMSFRAWALFMTVVHAIYSAITCEHFMTFSGITMADIFFIRGVEVLVTMVTMLRLYFIIEAHEIDLSEKSGDRIDPIGIITDSIKKAVIAPENPKEINGNAKKVEKRPNSLRNKIINILF